MVPSVDQLNEQRRKVDFDTYDISVQQLISMVEKEQIDVSPVYQRHFRWDDERQSQFIESVFLGIPIPSLFMAANSDATWELVDGVQRLSTLIRYAGSDEARAKLAIATPLALSSLEKLTTFEAPFTDLSQTLRDKFLLRPIKVTTLSDKSDLIVRFDLFERLNTGGVVLTDQEIRACIFRGQFSDFLERMAQNRDFRKVVRLRGQQEKDGTREECVLRFFAFLNEYRSFEHSVVGFLNDYMKLASKTFDYAAGEATFKRTFQELFKALPNGIVRNRQTTPLNLFEGVAVGAALALRKRRHLKTIGGLRWMASPELKKFVTGGTNNRAAVVGRVEYCATKFGGA